MNSEKRHLYIYAPEILGRKELPVNFIFTQFFVLDIEPLTIGETKVPFDELFQSVKVETYQTDNFGIFSTLGKPISKMIR
jgi:hypothetical protein